MQTWNRHAMKVQCVVLLLPLWASRLRPPESADRKGRAEEEGNIINLHKNIEHVKLFIHLNHKNTAWIQRAFIAGHTCNEFQRTHSI